MIPEIESLLPTQPFNRREFVLAALGSGFALAVQPVMAQSVIHTDTAGLAAGTVEVPVEGGSMRVYRAQPAKAARKLPTVLVISEIFGVHEHIADVCRRLAKEGYLALAPDLFMRQGDPSKIDSIPEIQKQIISKVPDAQVRGDLDALVAWATKNGADPRRIAITGFCWGGRIVWLYANQNPAIRTGVAWYGKLTGPVSANNPRQPISLADNMQAPVLGLYGGQDQGIPQSDVDDMNARLKTAGSESHIVVYPEAPHAFNADYRSSYREAEARDGWKKMLAWFRQHGV